MGSNYVIVDRKSPMLMPPDLLDWVAGDDMVQLVVDVVEMTDISAAVVNERGTGSAQYPPRMMLGLLIYAYARGTRSSRQIERMTYDSVAARYVCANTHPDHDTIATFRRRNGALMEHCFVRVLELARELGVLKVGTVSMDGSKFKANAAKRRTLERAQLQALVKEVLAQAEAEDQQPIDDGLNLPQGLVDPQARLARLRAAAERLDAQEDRKEDRDKKGKGGPPRINTTDGDSGLMPTRQEGFVQGYNAQIVTPATGCRLIVGARVTQHTTDRQEMVANLQAVPPQLGTIRRVLADMGYDAQNQISELNQKGITVYCPPQGQPADPTRRRSRTQRELQAARAQRRIQLKGAIAQAFYRRRSPSTEPVFHTIKNIMGCRQFLLRGLSNVQNEWNLIALAFNCRSLARRLA